MALISLLLILLPVQSCLTTFHIIKGFPTMNSKEALTACRTNYTDLVTLYSEKDHTELVNMLPASNTKAWIGLYRGQLRDKWSNSDDVTFSSKTGNCGTGVCCSAMKPDGSWESLQCTETKPFMCYKKDNLYSSIIYHVIYENKSWYDAQSYCRRNYTDLVSIRDQQQNEEVKIKGGNGTTSFWIGLLYDDWEWRDGGRSAYRDWGTGQPRPSSSSSSDCVLLFYGKCYSVPCSNQVNTALCSHTSVFQIIQKNMSQTEALTACRTNYTNLVTLYSEEDNDKLINLMQAAGIRSGWIGLYRGQPSDKWSNGDAVTFCKNKVDCGTEVCCTAMKPNGSWERLNCTDTKPFMCYKKVDSCSPIIYHVIFENKSWYDAQSYCRKNYTDLVSIRDQQQNQEVKIKGGNSTTSFWIGLLRDDWEWRDGGRSAYRNWGTGSPRPSSTSSNCVRLLYGKWYSVPCSNQDQGSLCSHTSVFQIIQKNMSQTEALTACRTNYTDLVTLYSEEDNAKLVNVLKINNITRAWIGLYRGQLRDKWSNGDDVTFSSKTGNCGTGVCCSAMKPDGSWERLNCTDTRPFMCYEEVSCSPIVYHVIYENKSWYDAQSYCRRNYTDLVSIRDQQQNEEVKIKGGNSTTSFWIGLLYDDWEWRDGGRSAYRNWGTGSPRPVKTSSNCTIMKSTDGTGIWFTVPCGNTEFVACYSNDTTVV